MIDNLRKIENEVKQIEMEKPELDTIELATVLDKIAELDVLIAYRKK